MVRFSLIVAMALAVAGPVAAQSIRNLTGVPVRLQDGPGPGRLTAGLLQPGEVAELGPCDAFGRWCLLSTDSLAGWVDASLLPLGVPEGAPRADPGAAVPPAIDVTPLPGRALPDAIVNAVPEAPVEDVPLTDPIPDEWVPGTRPPFLLSLSEPTVNVTTGEINLRAGPGTDAPVLAQLAPGQGGMIDTCLASEAWCRIRPLDGSRPGWVKMTLMGERRLTDLPPAR
ncbi:MAG: SH3 domain-containing protein [Jannaschia sp.]